MKHIILLAFLTSCSHYVVDNYEFSEPDCSQSWTLDLMETKYHSKEECLKSDDFKKVVDQRNEPTRLKQINEFVAANPKIARFRQTAIEKKIDKGMPEALVYLSWGQPSNTVVNTETFGKYKKQLDYPNVQVYLENGYVDFWRDPQPEVKAP